MDAKGKKWNTFTTEETLVMREKIKFVIKDQKQSWAKLSEHAGLDRSNMKASVERSATHLNKFLNLMGYELEFKKRK